MLTFVHPMYTVASLSLAFYWYVTFKLIKKLPDRVSYVKLADFALCVQWVIIGIDRKFRENSNRAHTNHALKAA